MCTSKTFALDKKLIKYGLCKLGTNTKASCQFTTSYMYSVKNNNTTVSDQDHPQFEIF